MNLLMLALLLQTPPTPVVLIRTPAYDAVQMFADGSTVLPNIPASILRVPPQDSNDIGMVFNGFGRDMCLAAQGGNAVVLASLTKWRISCGK